MKNSSEIIRKIPLGRSRTHNFGYLCADGLLKVPRQARDWHENDHPYRKTILRQDELKRGDCIRRLQENPHPNIAKVFGLDRDWVYLEYVEGCVLSNKGPYCPEPDKQRPCWIDQHAMVDLAPIRSAINHLHSLGIAHTDITEFNIMVNSDGQLKLIDLVGAVALTPLLRELDWQLFRRMKATLRRQMNDLQKNAESWREQPNRG